VRLLFEVILDQFEDDVDDVAILCRPALEVKFNVDDVLEPPRC